jgi:CRISPR-associated protein Cas5t
MLLSLVGERFRRRHVGVHLAFAYKRVPQIATTLRKLSRYKYGVPSKQSTLGNAPDFVETLCGIDFLCWVDSSEEKTTGQTLEQRIVMALTTPESVERYGVLCLGLSDDAVNDVRLCDTTEGEWYRLVSHNMGALELPVWVDHVGAAKTRWQRYHLESHPTTVTAPTPDQWTQIMTPD